MLAHQVLRFLPSQIVPAVAAFAGVYVFTRFATPAEYGLFALAMSVAQMCQSVLFYWVQVGATRHIDSARQSGALAELQSAVYRSHAVTFALLAAVYATVLPLLPLRASLRQALWYALAIVGLRSLVAVNQAFHRGELRAARYNLIECVQAALQLGLGLAFLRWTASGANGLLASVAAAALLVALIDARAVLRMLRRPSSRAQVIALLRFGLPLSASFALNYILATSDRLLIEYYLGSAAVGTYSVAYGLMDRAIGSIFVAVSLVAFPLAIRALERDGPAGASRQLRANGRLLMLATLPVVTLLICLSPQLAAVMVGAAFREEAAAIMPWVAVGALMAGFQIHFFDHAFHLSKRTMLFLLTAGPAAVLNIVANMVLLPRLGLMGAVWSTLASYALSLAASIVVGSRVLRVPLDTMEFGRVAAACLALAIVVLVTPVPFGVLGFLQGAALGLATFAVAAFGLNVGGLRSRLSRWRSQPGTT